VQTPTWSHSSFGGSLSEPAKNALIKLGAPRVLRANAFLVRQGDKGRSVYVVLDGRLSVTMLVHNGTVSLLAIRHPGDLVGEIALLGDGVRTASVLARDRSIVLAVPPRDFLDFLTMFPEASLAIGRMGGDRLIQANTYRADAAGYDVEVRLARALLYQCARMLLRANGRLSVELKQSELAMLIGAKEGTVQKALRSEAMRDLVLSQRGRVLILDISGLAMLADMPVPQELT
jgi:CRP/FNR family transcriptional regulator, cyclic AMP receptor protein